MSTLKTKKEERSEYTGIWVTPSAKKEFDMAGDNKELQDKIIRNLITSETDWLESEMQEIDEATVKYRGKLIAIKDNFTKANDIYQKQIEEIYELASSKFKGLNQLSKNLDQSIKTANEKLSNLSMSMNQINPDKLERLLSAVETFNRMDSKSQELIRLIIESGEK